MKKKFMLYCSLILVVICTTPQSFAQECATCPGNTVTGTKSSAFGDGNTVSSNYSFIAGRNSIIHSGNHHGNIIGSQSAINGGFHSIVIGSNSSATNDFSFVFGPYSRSKGSMSFALGSHVEAWSGGSFIIGNGKDTTKFINTIPNSLMIGFGSVLPTFFVEKAPHSFANDRTGRIGIGNVTSPQAKLHIRGDAQEDASLLLEPTDYRRRAAALYMLDSNTGLSATHEEGLNISTSLERGITFNAPYVIFREGKVGINVEIPEYNFDVNGDARLTGSIMAASLLISGTTVINSDRIGRFANGSESLPAYSFSENTNTGMFRPGSNTIAFSTAGTEKVRILSNGNVGIGTNDPKEKLSIYSNGQDRRPLNFHIGGNQYIYNNAYWDGNCTKRVTSGRAYGIRFSDPCLAFDVAGTGTSGSTIQWNRAMIIDTQGNIGIGITNDVSPEKLFVNGFIRSVSGFRVNENTVIDANTDFSGRNGFFSGHVGIGITNPQKTLHVTGESEFNGNMWVASANIYVSGEVHANKFRATLDIPWPDYVFDPSYYLPNLSYVEQFVAAHRHLPGLPSAQTIEKDGIELAEMNALLLKKIEELTLYLIEQQKELNDLKVKMARIENQ